MIRLNQLLNFINEEFKLLKFTVNPDFVKPQIASILLTTKCNGKCIMCDIWQKKPPDEIEYSKLEKILITLKNFGIKHISLLGGEPLMYPYIWKTVKFIKNNFKTCGMITNGLLINDDNIERIKHFFDLISVSIDASSEKLFSKIRGYPLKNVIKGVKLLKKYNIEHRIVCTLQALNIDDTYNMYSLARELGSDILFSFVEISGYGNKNNKELLKVDIKKLELMLKKIQGQPFVTNDAKGFKILLDHLRKKNTKFVCSAPFQNIAIFTDGNVYPCSVVEKPMGNVFKQSISEIYYSNEFINFRKNVAGKKQSLCWQCVHGCSIDGSMYYQWSLKSLVRRILLKIKRIF